MTRHWWIWLLVALGVAGILLIGIITGRSSSSSENQAEAVSQLCQSLGELNDATQSLTSLDPSTTTIDQVQTDIAHVDAVWNEVDEYGAEVKSATVESLDTAWNAYENAVSGISSSSTVGDAVTTVQTAGQSLVAATQSTISSLSCS